MDFTDVIFFLLANFPGSLDSELRTYFKDRGLDGRLISESVVSQSRNHLNAYPFKRMFEIVRERYLRFEETYLPFMQPLIYCGVDGSYLNLPDFKALLNYFGGRGRNKDSPTGQICLIFGSFSHFIYEAELEPLRFTERSLALERLEDLSRITHLQRLCFVFKIF